MNKYDLEHVTTDHPQMSRAEWEDIYQRAWDIYYSPEHVETMMRRAAASTGNPRKQTARLAYHVAQFYGTMRYEKVHPLQSGYFRRKVRTQRRYGLPRENPLLFYPRRVWETIRTYLPVPLLVWRLLRMRRRILADPEMKTYIDQALTPVQATEQEQLELFRHTQAAREAVAQETTTKAANQTRPSQAA